MSRLGKGVFLLLNKLMESSSVRTCTRHEMMENSGPAGKAGEKKVSHPN